jgi:hypothetical protein
MWSLALFSSGRMSDSLIYTKPLRHPSTSNRGFSATRSYVERSYSIGSAGGAWPGPSCGQGLWLPPFKDHCESYLSHWSPAKCRKRDAFDPDDDLNRLKLLTGTGVRGIARWSLGERIGHLLFGVAACKRRARRAPHCPLKSEFNAYRFPVLALICA